MNANVIEFYQKVRADQGLMEALSEGQSPEEISEIAVSKAADLGMQLEKNEVLTVFGQGRFEEFIGVAANDDELTDFELEAIAAGVPMTCIDGGA